MELEAQSMKEVLKVRLVFWDSDQYPVPLVLRGGLPLHQRAEELRCPTSRVFLQIGRNPTGTDVGVRHDGRFKLAKRDTQGPEGVVKDEESGARFDPLCFSEQELVRGVPSLEGVAFATGVSAQTEGAERSKRLKRRGLKGGFNKKKGADRGWGVGL